MPSLVSILIPAFNAERWIEETIRSALGQTWPAIEIIVVDDGSSDRTLELARRFSGITVVPQQNAGAAAARNHAYSLSHGEYIQWLDADDLLAPDKVGLQMRAAQDANAPRVLFSSSWGAFSYRPSHARFTPTPLWCDLAPLEWLLRKWEGNFHMQTGTWLASRELCDAAGPWETRLSMDDDGEYFCRVIRASERIHFVADANVLYRVTDFGRLSHVGRSRKKMESQFLSMKLQIGYLLQISDDARTKAACLNYLQTWLPTFYPDRPDIVAEAEQLAAELGGTLRRPVLGWKYAWLEKLFGPGAGKQAQLEYNRCKSSVFRMCDKILYSVETARSKANADSKCCGF